MKVYYAFVCLVVGTQGSQTTFCVVCIFVVIDVILAYKKKNQILIFVLVYQTGVVCERRRESKRHSNNSEIWWRSHRGIEHKPHRATGI